MKTSPHEMFPVVDTDGNVIGSATRGECHSGSKILHPVVHLHVVSADGSLLLQKRAMSKDIQPGRWDTAVGGHVDCGETPFRLSFARRLRSLASMLPERALPAGMCLKAA